MALFQFHPDRLAKDVWAKIFSTKLYRRWAWFSEFGTYKSLDERRGHERLPARYRRRF
jgi:hypothetical protein